MAKRYKGITFLLIGCVLLLAACGWYLYNIIEDRHAGKNASELLKQLDSRIGTIDDELDDVNPCVDIHGKSFLGKICIHKLGIELPVYKEFDNQSLQEAPCRYSGSIASNDIIIAAHNYKSHFGNLHKMKIGDEVCFTDVYGINHYYEVRELQVLDGTAISDMKSGEWDFTLFTCAKSGTQRVTVRCIRK